MKHLFCFPYAGSSATIYARWRKFISPDIAIHPVELPGRGARLNEPLCNDIKDMVSDTIKSICIQRDDDVYLFGHSMGALLAYEVALALNDNGINVRHLFFSGANSPNMESVLSPIYHLPNSEFIEHILANGNTAVEVFEDEALRAVFLPILRADYTALDCYKFTHRTILKCDYTLLYGINDRYVLKNYEMWSQIIAGRHQVHEFEGDHFFIIEHAPTIAGFINNIMH